jgi:hypothetical protein
MSPRGSAALVSCLLVGCYVRGPASTASPSPAPSGSVAPLRIRYLGVSGFLIEQGQEAVLTAPLFTRPSWLEVTTGAIASNPAAVEANLPPAALSNVKVVLTGHGHYDHLLDVPSILQSAPQATLLANRSARNVLAALAPDRNTRCAGTPAPARPLARSRVVALDDPARSVVDYTYCPSKRPANAPATGSWVRLPASNVRVYALCSEHPEQLGPMHYAPGGVEEEQCAMPARAADWLEGTTLAFLVDFLDPASQRPLYRVYFQDAPTNAPAGLVPEPILREKRVDVALLCVGAYEHVADAPTRALLALAPRYAIGGHWEDFSRPTQEAPSPIPLLDLATWVARARYAMPRGGEPHAMLDNGAPAAERFAVPRQGELFQIGP